MRSNGSKRHWGLVAVALAATLISLACNGGSSDSPTAPPLVVYAQISGAWSGDWTVVELGPAAVEMNLAQAESSVSGTLVAEGFPLAIVGTLSPRDAAGDGSLEWHVPDSELDCGDLRGTLRVSQAATRLEGNAIISTVGCDDQPETHEGPMVLSRSAGAALRDPGAAAILRRTLSQLARRPGGEL